MGRKQREPVLLTVREPKWEKCKPMQYDQVVVDSTVMFYYVDQALAWSYGTKSVCLLTI